MNKTAIVSFVSAAFAVKTEDQARALLAQWEGAASDEAWWIASGAPGARLSAMRAALLPLYAASRPAANGSPSKGEATERAPRKVYNVTATLSYSYTDDKGNTVNVEVKSKGFDRSDVADDWARRALVAEGRADAIATIVDARKGANGAPLFRDKVIDYDKAIGRVLVGERRMSDRACEGPTDRTSAPIAEDVNFERLRPMRTPASGWQKVDSDRARFSGADRVQESRERVRDALAKKK